MAEGQGEIGVPHEHRARCAPLDHHRTDGQAFEGGVEGKVDLVRAFPQALDREVRLAALCRIEPAEIVAGPLLAVRAGVHHREHAREEPVHAPCHAERIVAGFRVRACHPVGAFWENNIRVQVPDDQL